VTNYGVGGRTMLKESHLPPGDHASYWNTTQVRVKIMGLLIIRTG
jgi:hypothetical protein